MPCVDFSLTYSSDKCVIYRVGRTWLQLVKELKS